MALKGYRWDTPGSVDHKKDMLDELDDYLNSAHRFIEEAEQQIRDKPQSPPKPSPTSAPTTSSNRNERFPRWSYSSLNSAARKKRVNGCWEREHCGATNSLKALLDSLDIPSEDCQDQHEKQDNQTMNIKEIEKMTRDLLEGLDDIGDAMPVPERKLLPSASLAATAPTEASPARSQGAQPRKIAPPTTLILPSPFARFARKHLNRTLSSETGDEFSTFLEELCDQGEASPSWHFVPRRYRSVESLSDSDQEESTAQPMRLWTSEEIVSDKSNKSLVSPRRARVRETPSPVGIESFDKPLDKQGLLVALTKIGEKNGGIASHSPPPASNAKSVNLISSDEDIFAEFEAEFTATLTRKSRKTLNRDKPLGSGSRSEIAAKLVDSWNPAKPQMTENRATNRKQNNVQLRADFFAGMVNGDSSSSAATRESIVTTTSNETPAVPVIEKSSTTRGDHDLKDKAREKVQLEALNHPLLISYRSAIQKNAAVLQSNPDLSQILSNARAENRKSLIIPCSEEARDPLPHNCRVLPDKRETGKNTKNIANNSNNNSVDKSRTRSPDCPNNEQSDPYSEEFERSMDSLETFTDKLQLDKISAGFDEEMAKLFPSAKRSEAEEQNRSEPTASKEAKKPKVVSRNASNGSFLGRGGRRSDEKSLSPASKTGNSRECSPCTKSSGRHQLDALPRLPKAPATPNGLRPESPDLAMFELNRSEQILAQLVKSSTDPAVAKLLEDVLPKIRNSSQPFPDDAVLCPCGKILESDEEARSELCKHCSASKAMRFLQACTNYGNKTNSLPILRGSAQPCSEVRLREKPVRPSKQNRSCRIEFPSEGSFSSDSSTSFRSTDVVRNGCPSGNPILRSNSVTDLHADQLSPEERRRWNTTTSAAAKAEDRRSSSGVMFLSPRRLSVPRLSLQTPTRSQLLESLTVQRRKLIRRCTAATLQSEDIESIECSNEADTADEKSAQIVEGLTGGSNADEPSASPSRDGGGPSQHKRSPRGSVAWIAVFFNPRFVRSFSERLAYNSYRKHYHTGKPKVECWWRKIRAHKLNEAEAIQALEWLRDTGFPQYAQQFEDNMFPLDMSTVQKDHEKLGEDEMQSLIRRLTCLNKCASMRAETKAKVAYHCSDEDLALSENWQFHRPSRRWSRIATSDLPLITKQDVDEGNGGQTVKPEPHSSHDSVFLTPNNRSPDSENHLPASLVTNSSLSASDERLQEQHNRSPTPSGQQTKLRRSGSERIRDAIVRKVDSFRRRRREARSKSPRSLRGNQSGLGQGSPKFLSPKGKRRECYDNQGLQGDSDAGDLESLSPITNNESLLAERNGEPRRDSGVGSCVTRTSVCSTEGSGLLAATKWHCYPGTPVHTLALSSNELVPLWRLTASDHMLLRKHALLRLTAIMERHCPPYKTGWTWTVPKFIKKMTTPSYKDKVLFGIPLIINVQRGGQPIPPCIQFAMQYIASKAPSCYGIFRKPGLKSRIDNLRAIHEQRVMNPSLAMYENQILFDIADMVKQYFREIPDGGLLTTKLAPTFRYIFMHIPESFRLEAVQCLVTIMPDENREALEALLCFLAELSQYGAANGMTASNLATCFAPSIFQSTQNFSPKRGRRDSANGDREINENIASNDCLSKMIEWHEELFCASEQTLHSLRIVVEEPSDIRNYLTDNGQPLYKLNFEVSLNWLLHEVRNSKGWTQISHPNLELACKRIEDDFHYVRLWKITVQVPASPTRILNRILFERALWDFSLVKQIFVCKIDSETEVCGIIQTEMGRNARRQYLLLRAWKTNITTKGACALVEVSVSDPLLSGNIDPDPEHCHASTPWVRAHVLASRYLIQPMGNGRSKVTHLARIEPMGRNGYWHSRSAGFVYALQLHNLAQSFEIAASTESIPSSSGSSATLAATRESIV